MSITAQNFSGRKHRTALFVDAAKRAANSEYRERSDRLIQSVNGSNIKVDVFEVDGSVVRPLGTTPSSTPTSEPDLQAWATSQGYTQVLVSQPGK